MTEEKKKMLPAKKSLGQNFLIDQNIIRKIVAAINPNEGETIVEVGPGQGAITGHLLSAGASIIALEKDERMVEPLTKLSEENDNRLTLNLGDALEVDYSNLSQGKLKFVGNLPYNVGTLIVIKALEHPEDFTTLTFMLQKEVVERICAKPSTSDWGRLGVLCDLLCDSKKLFDVPPGAFVPRPKVTSAIVQMIPLKKPRFDVDRKKLDHILRLTFGQRRKMLRATLKGVLSVDQIEELGISAQSRPETLSTEEFCKLANAI